MSDGSSVHHHQSSLQRCTRLVLLIVDYSVKPLVCRDLPALCFEFLDLVPSMRKGKTLDAGYTLHSLVSMARTSLRTTSFDSPTWRGKEKRLSNKKSFTVASYVTVSAMCTHLQYEVGDEGAGLVLSQVVVLAVQHGKQQLQILQHLHQDCGVGVKEAQGEPLQDQVQAADGGVALTFQPLSNTHADFIARTTPQSTIFFII